MVSLPNQDRQHHRSSRLNHSIMLQDHRHLLCTHQILLTMLSRLQSSLPAIILIADNILTLGIRRTRHGKKCLMGVTGEHQAQLYMLNIVFTQSRTHYNRLYQPPCSSSSSNFSNPTSATGSSQDAEPAARNSALSGCSISFFQSQWATHGKPTSRTCARAGKLLVQPL